MAPLEERDQKTVAERLADENDRPVEDYEYDGPVPNLDDLDTLDPEEVDD